MKISKIATPKIIFENISIFFCIVALSIFYFNYFLFWLYNFLFFLSIFSEVVDRPPYYNMNPTSSEIRISKLCA